MQGLEKNERKAKQKHIMRSSSAAAALALLGTRRAAGRRAATPAAPPFKNRRLFESTPPFLSPIAHLTLPTEMKTFRAQGEEEDDDDEGDEGSRIACPVNSLSIEERAKDGEVRSIVTPVAAVAAAAILACCDFLLSSSSRCFYDRLKIAPSTSQTSGKNFGATSKKTAVQ